MDPAVWEAKAGHEYDEIISCELPPIDVASCDKARHQYSVLRPASLDMERAFDVGSAIPRSDCSSAPLLFLCFLARSEDIGAGSPREALVPECADAGSSNFSPWGCLAKARRQRRTAICKLRKLETMVAELLEVLAKDGDPNKVLLIEAAVDGLVRHEPDVRHKVRLLLDLELRCLTMSETISDCIAKEIRRLSPGHSWDAGN